MQLVAFINGFTHIHSSLRQEQYLTNSNPVLVNSSHTENVYEALKRDLVDKNDLDNSLCTEMATTNIDCGDSEGTYKDFNN